MRIENSDKISGAEILKKKNDQFEKKQMDEKLKRRTDSILQFKFKNLKSKEKNK
jgi:hypothetical protein